MIVSYTKPQIMENWSTLMYRCFLKSCKNYTFKPSHNILTLFNNLAQVRITTSKTIPDIHNNKLATRVASRVPNELRLKILKN